MKIKVTGAGHKKAAEIKRATKFYAEYLMHKNKTKNLEIDIEVSECFPDQGLCVNEDESKPPKYFTIQLRCGKDDNDIIHTLAHEMVHLKQYAKLELTKDLIIKKGNNIYLSTLWMGKPYRFKSHEDEYFDSPWEIESYGREDHLYWKWKDHENSKVS